MGIGIGFVGRDETGTAAAAEFEVVDVAFTAIRAVDVFCRDDGIDDESDDSADDAYEG